MSTTATIDQIHEQIQLNGEPVKLSVSGPGYEVSGKHEYPVSIDFMVGGAKFCLEQEFNLEHTRIYEYLTGEESGHYTHVDSVILPDDHPILQWLKPITA